ncbi:hypothetical protein DMB66_43590 [Actinoplanes sp. ATCC 53533]|uniref:hypothetical protein n=1 Tax=Actinoplanes sp. ATCC 53533 TaxID=1288362 RepID=UPI000F7AA111|nr:hypothetical protein [Actinoplanes sp. ATCC 53533]RSM50480.1 hypothetical protein DMB66_43590 [Actinoplanes sp. ATCC 53533]
MKDIQSARRPRPAQWIALVAGVLVAATAVFVLLRGGGPHKVTFEVTSSGEKISSITYGSGTRQLGKDVGAAAAAPWSRSHELTDTAGELWLHVLSPAGGAITCTIWLDQKVVMEATTLSGATCEIPFEDALDQ